MKLESQNKFLFKKLVIVSVALHVSILIYAGVIFFISQTTPDWVLEWRIIEQQEPLLYALSAMAIGTAFLTFYAPRWFKTENDRHKISTPETSFLQQTKPLVLNFQALNSAAVTMTILRMTMAEAVAIYGFLNAFINQSVLLAVPFFAVGLILQFLVGPIFGYFFWPRLNSPKISPIP